LFFGEEVEVDLTEYYDPEAKKAIIKKVNGLLHILNSFKFTVAENTPIEEEIALDPELLGKVFENLLASYNPETKTTARKQTGSFYTPREIVNYMVDESLIEYLKQNTEIKTDDFESRLRNLFSYNDEGNPFKPKETDELIEAINNAKILDPACGSGAFPMGVLHKMVHLLQKLDPGNVKWKAQQKEKIIGNQIKELEKDKKAIAGLSDKAVREKAIQAVDDRLKEIDEIFESKNNFDDYARKLYLIENCIYGIDIQPIAVQISKLRFFISLIIDQDKDSKKDNLGFRSLPNLETKFVAANTLISLEIPTTDLFSENNPIKVLQEELKATRHEYFNAKTRKEKLRLQQQDKELRKKIAAQISDTLIHKKEEEIKSLEKQLAEAKKKLVQIEAAPEQKETIESTNIFGETETTVIDKKKEKIKAQKSTISFIEKQINSLKAADNKDAIQKVAQQISSFDPYDQNHFANWFEPEWMFGNEVKAGFDIVIGNPPYVDSETMTKDNPEFREYLKSKFQSAEGNWDLFVVFTEMGLKLCKSYGSLAFIVPNKIISAKYTYSLRTIICNLSPREIIDYSYVNVFKEADVYPVVILISNQETHKYQVSSKVMYNLEEIKTINLINSIQFTSDIFWDKYFFNPDVVNLIIKITSNDKLISKFPNILGAATVNEAYQVKEVIKELEKEKKYFKFTNTGTIDPYKSLWGLKQTQYIKGNYHKPIITKTDLDEINRTRTNQSSSPKIIIAGMALRIEAFYDEYGSYCAGKSTTIILGESQNLKTLTGIINSKLVSYWFSKYFNSLSMAGGYFNIGNNELGLIPLPNLNFPNNQINNIVDKILVENSNNPQSDTSSLEKQIDELVYKLYDLTEEEIKIIEGNE